MGQAGEPWLGGVPTIALMGHKWEPGDNVLANIGRTNNSGPWGLGPYSKITFSMAVDGMTTSPVTSFKVKFKLRIGQTNVFTSGDLSVAAARSFERKEILISSLTPVPTTAQLAAINAWEIEVSAAPPSEGTLFFREIRAEK